MSRNATRITPLPIWGAGGDGHYGGKSIYHNKFMSMIDKYYHKHVEDIYNIVYK